MFDLLPKCVCYISHAINVISTPASCAVLILLLHVPCSPCYQVFHVTLQNNTIISPNFLVWKFCGKGQFVERNCSFPQNFHTGKLGEITVFFTVSHMPVCSFTVHDLNNVSFQNMISISPFEVNGYYIMVKISCKL